MATSPYSSWWDEIAKKLTPEQIREINNASSENFMQWYQPINQAQATQFGEGGWSSGGQTPTFGSGYGGLSYEDLLGLTSNTAGANFIPYDYVKKYEKEFKALDPSFKLEGIDTIDHPVFGKVVDMGSVPTAKDGGWADVLAAALKIGGFATGLSGLANVATGAGSFFGPGNFATDLMGQISSAFGGDGGLLTSGSGDAVLGNGGALTDTVSQTLAEQIANAWTEAGVPMSAEEAAAYLAEGGTGIGATVGGTAADLTLADVLPGYDAAGNWTGKTADGTSIFEDIYGSEGVPNTIPWDGSGGTSFIDDLAKKFKDSAGNWDWSKLSLAGLGAGGLLGSLLDNGPTTSTSSATMTPNMPQWYTDAAQAALNKAQGMSYTPYSGNLNVNASPNQIAAANLASSSVGKFDPLLDKAQAAAEAGGQSILDMGIDKYMSPYWQNALNPQINKINQDRAITSNQIAADMAKKSMFGTSRFEVAKALSDQEFNRRIDDLMATGAQKAWEAGTGLATGDRSAYQTTGQNLANLASTGSVITGQDISRLGATGQSLYDVDVGNVNRDYSNWLASQTLPLQYQNALTGTLNAVKPSAGMTTTTTQTGASNNPWQNILGAGSMLWGLANPRGLS